MTTTPHAAAVAKATEEALNTTIGAGTSYEEAVIRHYLAAMGERGWKLTPRVMTMDMRRAQIDKPGPGDVCWAAGKAIQLDSPRGKETLPPFEWWSEQAWGAWALAWDVAPAPEEG